MKIITDKMEELLYEYMETYQEDKSPENGDRLCTVIDAVLSLAEEDKQGQAEDKPDEQDEQDEQEDVPFSIGDSFTCLTFWEAESKMNIIGHYGYDAILSAITDRNASICGYKVTVGYKTKQEDKAE